MRCGPLCWALALSPLAVSRAVQSSWSASPSIEVLSSPLGIPWEEVQSVPFIEQWALNPTGDAAVIKTSTLEVQSSVVTYDLTLLAINAQYTIPPVTDGQTCREAIYAFLSDDTFAVVRPADGDSAGFWQLEVRYLNYTIDRGAYPPTAGEAQSLGVFHLDGRPTAMAYSPGAGILNLLVRTTDAALQVLATLSLSHHDRSWTASDRLTWPLQEHNLDIEDFTASDSAIAFTAYNESIRTWNATRNVLFVVDHQSSKTITQISTGKGGAVTSPAFLPDGRLVWLEQRHDGNDRAQRFLWMWTDGEAKEVKLDFNLSPTAVIPSKNGEALNLLTLHDQEQSLFHLWTPSEEHAETITPVRIPSDHTIHSAIHVGISALNHSHLIGVKSSITQSHELFVISHSPFEDPADNYENIQLTDFGAATRKYQLTQGQRFYFANHLGANISGRVFLPHDATTGNRHPAVVFLHGDEEGGGWHDWWMQYWNPNAFLSAGYAVVQVNPTGAEGYGDEFTQARRYQWGNQTMIDLQLGLRHALAGWPIDPQNLFALGYGAFGGWAVHWLQGRNAEWGFRGFVSHDGIFSPRWWASESAAPAKTSWEFGPISYAKDSPHYLWDPERFVDSWDTPELLIVDGDNDANVGPASQSFAACAALRSKDVECKLVSSTSMNVWQGEIMDFLEANRSK